MTNDFLNIIHKTFYLSENESEFVEDSKDSRKALVNVLNTLNGREIIVLVLRNVYSMTYRESGEIMGITPERVRQIEYKSYRKLRHPTRSRVLKQFITHIGIGTSITERPSHSTGHTGHESGGSVD